MKLVPTKNYKNLYKKLNNKMNASIPLPNKMKKLNYYNCLDFEDVEITNEPVILTTNISLPNDIIIHILEFIPINTRISILKSKYNNKFLKNKLEKMNVKKLYKCAAIAEKLYHDSLLHYSDIKYYYMEINNLNPKEINEYPNYYKEIFIKIIISALKHHRKIYKKKKIINSLLTRLRRICTENYGMNIYVLNKILKKEVPMSYKGIPKFEKLLFKMYSQLILM